MTASVFVAGKLLPETMEALRKWDVKAFSGEENITEAELIKNVTEVDAIICPLSSPISAKVLESAKNLKIVANIGAGFDNIDVKKSARIGHCSDQYARCVNGSNGGTNAWINFRRSAENFRRRPIVPRNPRAIQRLGPNVLFRY